MEGTFSRRSVLKAAGAVTLVSLGSGAGGAEQTEVRTALPDRHGPMKTGRFKVEIDDVEVPGWQSVTIPSRSTEQGEYREGNDADYEKKIWGQTTVDDLEMERAMRDSMVYEWHEQVRTGNVDEGRKEIAVVLLDEEDNPQVSWEFTDAWLAAYDPPNLGDSADGDIATESITVPFGTMAVDLEPTAGENEHESGVSQELFEAVDADTDGELTLAELRGAVEDWEENEQIGGVDATLDDLRALVDWWEDKQ